MKHRFRLGPDGKAREKLLPGKKYLSHKPWTVAELIPSPDWLTDVERAAARTRPLVSGTLVTRMPVKLGW